MFVVYPVDGFWIWETTYILTPERRFRKGLRKSMKNRSSMLSFFVVMCLFNMAASFAHPVTPTVIKDLNLHDYMFGVALASMMIANFLMSPFWGKINTYISSRNTLLICCFGYGIGQVMFGLATTELMIILARVFAGIFTGGAYVSFLTYIVNSSSEAERGSNLMISATIQSVCSAFGYMIGGLLGEISVLLSFMAQAGTLMVCGILFFLITKKDNIYTLSQLSTSQLVREANPFIAFVDSRKFMTVMFAVAYSVVALSNLGYTAYEQCFNYYIKDQFGFTSSYNGLIKAAVGLISLVANMTICRWIIRKTNSKKSAVPVMLCCAVSILGVILAKDVMTFMVINVVFFAFNAVTVPVVQNVVASGADKGQGNMVMAFYNAIKNLGGIVGSLTAGFIYSAGPKLSFVFACAAFALGAVMAGIYAKSGGVEVIRARKMAQTQQNNL